MANINKIRLSGTTYNIEDANAAKAVELTQAQYDALVSGGTVDPNTFYIITDATAGDLTQYWTSAQTQSAINAATSGKVDTSSVVTAVTSASTDSQIPTAKAVWEAASGGSITIDPTLDSGSTNAVANSAITLSINKAFTDFSFGTWNGVDYIKYNKQGGGFSSEIYYPKINDISILTRNSTWASNNYNFQLVPTSAVTSSVTSASTDSEIPSAKAVYDAIQEGGGGGVPESAFTAYTAATDSRLSEDEEVTAAALNNINDRLSEDEEVTAAALNNLNDKFGGLKLQKITQTDYNNLQVKDANTLYVIVN